jgi:hypothetical protein
MGLTIIIGGRHFFQLDLGRFYQFACIVSSLNRKDSRPAHLSTLPRMLFDSSLYPFTGLCNMVGPKKYFSK